jgi:hypothetical protein
MKERYSFSGFANGVEHAEWAKKSITIPEFLRSPQDPHVECWTEAMKAKLHKKGTTREEQNLIVC